MASKKQRRRRAKERRHEYEYVIETDEGEEVVERLTERGEKKRDGDKHERPAKDRRGREIPKPSLQRVIRRAAIFGPIVFVFVFLTSGKDATIGGKITVTVMLLAFFIPFSYLVDVFMYRAFQRRRARQSGQVPKR